MIISHKYRFIFIKTRKTAGTSFEMALGDQCGPEDIITRVSMADEKVRRQLTTRSAQNYRMSINTYTWHDWKQLLTKGRFKRFENHDTAEKIVQFISKEHWDGYFKFCFERNPWDKMVSHYYWKKGVYQLTSFQEYLEKGAKGEITGFAETIHSKDQYSLNGRVVVDKIYKFEEMDASLDDIAERLGLDKPLKMPEYKAKGQYREDKKSYRELLTSEEARWIAEQFKWEIEHLGYTF
jgi:hypothetical protein